MIKNNEKDYSLASHGLNYKLRIAFYLMSILPLLVCIYLVSTYILPGAGLKIDIVLSILISIFITLIGFYLIKEIFDRVLSVTTDAKLIAAGDINRKIEPVSRDEVGDLGEALNELSQRIRNNIDELNSYSEKTAQINIDIQKRVLVLSGLLQLSALISQGAKLEDILEIATQKSRLLANSDVAYLLFREMSEERFSMKAVDGINSAYLLKIKVAPQESIFDKIAKPERAFILDKKNVLPENLTSAFYEKFRLKNILGLPVYIRGRVTGMLCVGNNQESFLYNKDDPDLLNIIAKQVGIAIENDILTHQIEKLQVKDPLTGLYNEIFIRSRLQEEIKRAVIYHRPCSFMLMNVDGFRKFHQSFGSLQAEATLKRIASLLRDSVTEIDRVARTGDNEFAIVLPEKNKRQAEDITEEIRKKIEFAFSEEEDFNKRLTISAGLSENPLDGIEAEELITKAKELLARAKREGKNRICL